MSDYFNLKLFNLYLRIKNNINLFNSTNWNSFYSLGNKTIQVYKSKNKTKLNWIRNYSTYSNNDVESESQFDLDTEYNEKDYFLLRDKAIKEFKKIYKGGYLGYNQIYHFGNITEFGHLTDKAFQDYYYKLQDKVTEYLSLIPENITYSVLPVLRWQTIKGEFNTITVTNSSIKLTRDVSDKYLAKIISNYIYEALKEYQLRDLDIELYLMGRPWLNIDEFNVNYSEVTEVLNNQIEKEIYFLTKNYNLENKKFLDKAYNLKNYIYSNVIMNNYGESVYDKNNNLITLLSC